MTPLRKSVFCATDFYLPNGIRYWIFLLHGCLTNQINIYSLKGGSVKPFFGTFLLCFNFLHLSDALWHGMEFQNGFSFGTSLKLVKIWKVTTDQLHRIIALRSYDSVRKFVFWATDFYLANEIRYWIFLLHGCWTNQIIYTLQRAAWSNHFFGTFMLRCNFLHLSDALWHGTEFQNGFSFGTNLKLVKALKVIKDQLHK